MSLEIENESAVRLDLDYEGLASRVIEQALDYEKCPYEVEINLILTSNEEIARINKEFRGIDTPTDVLSFPLIDFIRPADFTGIEEQEVDSFNPETGELMLGDIIISEAKVVEQALEYGHSFEREYAFLITHSVLHLLGYDHTDEEDARNMETKQEEILQLLKIPR